MRWLGRLALGVLVLAVVALGAHVWRGPFGPLVGGPLFGERVREPVTDWSFTDAVPEIEVETRWGPLPWSVTTWCLSHDGTLYVPARNGGQKRWTRHVMEHPDTRLRIAGKLYDVRLVRTTDSAETEPLGRVMLAKYLGIEADAVRPVTDPALPGQPRAEMWIFRVEPRS